MITIDGSFGEGGGQILRTSIALSALLLKPIKIINIRKNRPKPGLMPQHLTGIKIAGEFTNAEIKGLEIGSTEVEFIPKSCDMKNREIDIGTAGSIGLLLQTLTPLLIFADDEIILEIIGGTAGLGAPTIEYMQNVTFPVLEKFGIPLPDIEIVREGFYPKGHGQVRITFKPVKKLKSVKLLERGKIRSIGGISVVGSLPEDIARREADGIKKILIGNGLPEAQIEKKIVETHSPGTSVTLWSKCENSVLGSDAIGEGGKRAEKVGEDVAFELVKSINSGAALDKHMSDQIIPFMALAKNRSEVSIEELTGHCRTNIDVIEKILGIKFQLTDDVISVDGIDFKK
ncbi:MAG: RNA 3'-terminal phosphate cyclase [Candidatus Aenigmarchaeota archaeon]|nr:RNA 3'-terminal phosphate cyclase [Candidatus Aenigmarchaeota archaeon]